MEWYVLVLLSAVFLTFQHLFQKKVLFREHATEYLTAFCLLMVLALLPFSRSITFLPSAKSLVLLYLIGLLSAFTLLPWIRAYRHLEISAVEPLRNIGPLATLLLAALLLGERVDSIHFLGIFLILGGSYILEVAIFKIPWKNPFQLVHKKYMSSLFLSTFIGSITAVLAKIVLSQVTVLTFMFYTFLFASFHLLILQFAKYQGMHDVFKVVRADWKILSLIVAFTLFSDFLHFSALAMPATLVSLAIPLRRISTLFVTLVGGEFFHENRLFEKTLACIIMLVGTYFLLL